MFFAVLEADDHVPVYPWHALVPFLGRSIQPQTSPFTQSVGHTFKSPLNTNQYTDNDISRQNANLPSSYPPVYHTLQPVTNQYANTTSSPQYPVPINSQYKPGQQGMLSPHAANRNNTQPRPSSHSSLHRQPRFNMDHQHSQLGGRNHHPLPAALSRLKTATKSASISLPPQGE